MDESSMDLGYPETPLLEQLPGATCEMGDWKQRFCCPAFSRELGLPTSSGLEREKILLPALFFLEQHGFSTCWGDVLLTGRHRAQKNKCVTSLSNMVSFQFWGFVVEEFEGLAHLG